MYIGSGHTLQGVCPDLFFMIMIEVLLNHYFCVFLAVSFR